MSWTLTSIKLPDGLEALILKDGRGRLVREYTPSKAEPLDRWLCYSFGFPIKEFVSRDACIFDAKKQAVPENMTYISQKEHGREL